MPGSLIDIEIHQDPLYASVSSLSICYHLVSLLGILNDNFLRLTLCMTCFILESEVAEWTLESPLPIVKYQMHKLYQHQCQRCISVCVCLMGGVDEEV